MIEVLANVMVVIVLQHKSVSNQLVDYFKLIQHYMSIISQQGWIKMLRKKDR